MAHETEMTSLINDLLENATSSPSPSHAPCPAVPRSRRRKGVCRTFLAGPGSGSGRNCPWPFPPRTWPSCRKGRRTTSVSPQLSFHALYGASSSPARLLHRRPHGRSVKRRVGSRDFMDIIQQRLYHLYFECWSKYDYLTPLVEQNNPVDKNGFCASSASGKRACLRHARPYSLTSSLHRHPYQKPRSAPGLKTILPHALGMNSISHHQNIRRKVPHTRRPAPAHARKRWQTIGMDTVSRLQNRGQDGQVRIRSAACLAGISTYLLPGTTAQRQTHQPDQVLPHRPPGSGAGAHSRSR